MTANTSTFSSQNPLKVGPLVNHSTLLPLKRTQTLDLTAEKMSRLAVSIRSFTRMKDEISFELWQCLQRNHVVTDQDSSLYMDNFDQEVVKDIVDRFHAAVSPYVMSVDPKKETLSIDPPLSPIRFILS